MTRSFVIALAILVLVVVGKMLSPDPMPLSDRRPRCPRCKSFIRWRT